MQQGGKPLALRLEGERSNRLERDLRAGLEHEGELHQWMLMPPSMTTAAPVMNDESSLARNSAALAISSCVPYRASGCSHAQT